MASISVFGVERTFPAGARPKMNTTRVIQIVSLFMLIGTIAATAEAQGAVGSARREFSCRNPIVRPPIILQLPWFPSPAAPGSVSREYWASPRGYAISR